VGNREPAVFLSPNHKGANLVRPKDPSTPIPEPGDDLGGGMTETIPSTHGDQGDLRIDPSQEPGTRGRGASMVTYLQDVDPRRKSPGEETGLRFRRGIPGQEGGKRSESDLQNDGCPVGQTAIVTHEC
jgi:hypothetical protein